MPRTKSAAFAVEPWLTPAEVARTLHVNSDKIRGWINSGELVAVNVAIKQGGRARWRIRPEALDDFAERRRAVVAPVPSRRRSRSNDVIEFY